MSDTEPSSEEKSDESDRIKNQRQYGMYLPEELIEEINDTFDQINAERVIRGDPKIEKNKHFNVALVRCALENNLRAYVEMECTFE